MHAGKGHLLLQMRIGDIALRPTIMIRQDAYLQSLPFMPAVAAQATCRRRLHCQIQRSRNTFAENRDMVMPCDAGIHCVA